MATDWGRLTSSTFGSNGWGGFNQADPLNQGGSAWSSMPSMYSYDQRMSGNSIGYDPLYGSVGASYDPYSSFSSRLIDSNIDAYIAREHPELFDFQTGNVNSGGGFAGDVSQNPSFGQFAQDPSVYAEIAAAANKYGIPANLLKVMIARESSGDWASNAHATYLPSRGERIVGYTGIMESTARAWGYDFDSLVGNRALQIDAMANGLQRLYSQVGGQYGWDGVIATYYSGNPDQSYTPGDSVQYGTTSQYVNDVKSWWQQEDAWTKANGGDTYRQGTSGMATINTGDWQGVNQWDDHVATASNKYGVPANLIKSIIRMESNGVPTAVSVQGATGLMQVMPFHDGGRRDRLLDPAYNIDMGTRILADNYKRYGSWEMAAKAYLGLEGSDANGTNNVTYWTKVNSYWKELDAGVSGQFGGEPGDMGAVTTLEAVWGNIPGVSITQRNGEVNDWTTGAGAHYYDYAVDYLGYGGAHPGNDYGMPYGTKIFSPVGGEVIIVTSGYYNDEAQMGKPQTGELRVRLDNGHELIFGHMAGIHVAPGTRVQPGQYVGLSGTAGSGPHLHLEYRIPDSSMGSGWRSVDPEDALRGAFTGSFNGTMTGAGIDRPMTYQEMLRASANGQPIYGGATIGGNPNTWNGWLQSAMRGEFDAGRVGYGTMTGGTRRQGFT